MSRPSLMRRTKNTSELKACIRFSRTKDLKDVKDAINRLREFVSGE